MKTYDRLFCTYCSCNAKQVRSDPSMFLFTAVIVMGIFCSIGAALMFGLWGLLLGFFATFLAAGVTLLTSMDLAASTWFCTVCGTRYNHAAVTRMGMEAVRNARERG